MKQLSSIRNIQYLVVHCHAGNQFDKAEDIARYEKFTLGWKRSGYHVVIEKEARSPEIENSGVVRLISDDLISNGVAVYNNNIDIKISNSNSVNICYTGGLKQENKKILRDRKNNFIPVDNRTEYQLKMMESIIKWYVSTYPDIKILGHNQVAVNEVMRPTFKTCPNFSVPRYLKSIGISDKNIYFTDNFTVLERMKY
jgi:N-acetyl-anhydromuramyl-L-alanine amidase AmpD